MNNEIKEHLYELMDMCMRALKCYHADDEHYETLISLISYRCRDYRIDYDVFILKGEEE